MDNAAYNEAQAGLAINDQELALLDYTLLALDSTSALLSIDCTIDGDLLSNKIYELLEQIG